MIIGKAGHRAKWNNKALPAAANRHISPNAPLSNSSFFPSIMSCIHITVPRYLLMPNLFSSVILFLLCMNSDVKTDVIHVMGIRMQNHKCNEVENAFHTKLYFTKLAAKHRKHRKQTNSKTQQISEQTK